MKKEQFIKLLASWIPLKKLRRNFRIYLNKQAILFNLKGIQSGYKKKIALLKNKDQINICFFTISNPGYSSNVLQPVYEQFAKDPRFNATIVISPNICFSENYTKDTCFKTEEHLKLNNINYLNGYDIRNQSAMSPRLVLKPDITFFMMPYDNLFEREFNAENYFDTLTCYIPYSYMLANNMQSVLNTVTTNKVWKIFGDSNYHEKLLKQYAYNKGENIAPYQGFTKMESFQNTKTHNEWKIKDDTFLKIIWSPHHSMGCYANFPRFYKLFIELAEKFKDRIQIAFRPHPVLKETLLKHSDWGKEKTEEYYKKWANMPNTFYHTGEYSNLFKTSDALILDSVSFMAEYMFVNKPLLFLNTEEEFGFNPFGKIVNQHCYNGDSKEDIENFIKNQVLEGDDYMMEERESFVKNYLAPPNNQPASKNIYNYIIKEIEG